MRVCRAVKGHQRHGEPSRTGGHRLCGIRLRKRVSLLVLPIAVGIVLAPNYNAHHPKFYMVPLYAPTLHGGEYRNDPVSVSRGNGILLGIRYELYEMGTV